jgi:hypothetical protein
MLIPSVAECMSMRWFFAVCVALLWTGLSWADPNQGTRHGLNADTKTYPQATPKETLASVLKAIDDKKSDYLAAHLADPDWVDKRLKEEALKFPEFVEGVKAKLITDPGPAKLLKRFLTEGEWEVKDDKAIVTLKDVPDRGDHPGGDRGLRPRK